MHLKHVALGLAVIMAVPTAATAAQAENGILRSAFHLSDRPLFGVRGTRRQRVA